MRFAVGYQCFTCTPVNMLVSLIYLIPSLKPPPPLFPFSVPPCNGQYFPYLRLPLQNQICVGLQEFFLCLTTCVHCTGCTLRRLRAPSDMEDLTQLLSRSSFFTRMACHTSNTDHVMPSVNHTAQQGTKHKHAGWDACHPAQSSSHSDKGPSGKTSTCQRAEVVNNSTN